MKTAAEFAKEHRYELDEEGGFVGINTDSFARLLDEYLVQWLNTLDLGKMVGESFDMGFNISNEKFNAELRDQYEAFDDEDHKRYEASRNDCIEKYTTPK
jgi:hypothetical protein